MRQPHSKLDKLNKKSLGKTYIATELKADQQLVINGQSVELKGVKGQIDGDLVIKADDKTTFTAEKVLITTKLMVI